MENQVQHFFSFRTLILKDINLTLKTSAGMSEVDGDVAQITHSRRFVSNIKEPD